MEKRISTDQLYTEIATLFAKRSRCTRLRVGCIVVKNKRIITSGCNGPIGATGNSEVCECPINSPCGELGSVHAEVNAIAFAAKHGISLAGTEIYITHSPCMSCAKLIQMVGIIKITYLNEYRDNSPINYLKTNGINVEQYSEQL